MYKKSKLSLISQSRTFIPFSSSSSSTDSNETDSSEGDLDLKESYIETSSVFAPEECDPFNWVSDREGYCFDVERFAEKLIKATYIEAKKYLRPKPKLITVYDIVAPIADQIVNAIIPSDSVSETSPDFSGFSDGTCEMSSENSIDWPKISDFNIKLGLEKLEDYVSTWEGLNDWLFCIEFLGFECEDCSNVFVYEVEWSKPTKSYPIPQVTASVYFALDVFKMVPYKNDRNIAVSYVFEASSVIHVPGRIDFQEKWLQDILDAKTRFFQKFVFSTLPGDLKCDIKRTDLSQRISEIFDKK